MTATLREMVASKRLKLGTFVVEFNTPGMGQIVKAAGGEYVLLDMEHSGFNYETLKRMLRYYQSAEVRVIVSTAVGDYDVIARACDMGADAIQPAKVGSAEEARLMLAHMRYPPKGHRGVALGIAHDRYRPGDTAQKLRRANREVIFFPKIETRQGIENIEAIAALKGVSGIWIGHFDLSVDMGIPAQFDHPDFAAAMQRVARACRANNISLGRIAENVETGVALNRMGFDFLCYSGDIWLLRDSLKAGLDSLRAGCRKAKRRH
ncbi:MAG: hpch/hpai aldolase [Rhodospirillaceae bacterium]|jgi:4-hydroxy-2-oxoheptanedioate aldolase|nr:hpch/hpai aldolase [Rhodospirillaceae bacterium]